MVAVVPRNASRASLATPADQMIQILNTPKPPVCVKGALLMVLVVVVLLSPEALPLSLPPSSGSLSSRLYSSGSSPSGSSSSSSSDGEQDPDPLTTTITPRDKLSLTAARCTIALLRHLSANLSTYVDAKSRTNCRRIVPLLQTSFTLTRLLETVVMCDGLGGPWDDVAAQAR